MSGNVTSDPPAEPALKVDTREELVYLLGVAAWWLPPLVAVAATGASLRRISG
jgi:hypothetical protein